MESIVMRSCSSRSCTPFKLGGVVIAFDALKTNDIYEFKGIISDVLKKEEFFQEVGTLTLLGVLDRVLHPLGFQIKVGHKSFVEAHVRAIKEEVSRKVESYISVLQQSAEECDEKGIEIKVKIAVGAPLPNVLLKQISALNTTWAILGRQLSRESRCFLKKQLSCKIAQIRDDFSLEIVRPYQLDNDVSNVKKHKPVYSLSKPVPLPTAPDDESDIYSTIPLPVTPMIRSNNPNDCSLSSSTMTEEQLDLLNDDEFDKESLISLPITPMIRSNNLNNCPLSSSTNTSKEQVIPNDETLTNPQLEGLGCQNEVGDEHDGCHQLMQQDGCPEISSEVLVPCADMEKTVEGSSFSEMKIEPGEYSSDTSPEDDTDSKTANKNDYNLVDGEIYGRSDKMDTSPYSLGCSYENVQAATDNFSFDNFIGEGGYGIVYRGKLDDGQLVAVKVQKETKAQTCAEFVSEVSCLSFARHTNIVTLLGYCCKGNLRILIYEYISNKSLEWHLFDNAAEVLDWNQRCSVAVGAAKGLRYLHDECRGNPIVHCNIRPNNILLSHEFVPMLGDFGLDNSVTSKFDKQRKLLGNLGYVAPECRENDVGCVKADVYAFGILLMQLISGRKAVDPTGGDTIRQWAISLIQMLALEDLVDPRLGDAYCKYEVYNMARAAYLCVQTDPASRPTITEVLTILEGTNNHLRHVNTNLYPMIISADADEDADARELIKC